MFREVKKEETWRKRQLLRLDHVRLQAVSRGTRLAKLFRKSKSACNYL